MFIINIIYIIIYYISIIIINNINILYIILILIINNINIVGNDINDYYVSCAMLSIRHKEMTDVDLRYMGRQVTTMVIPFSKYYDLLKLRIL